MVRAHWLAVFAAFALLSLGCAEAQQRDYSARDGRVIFVLSRTAVEDAYNSFCRSQTERRCDALERYDLMVNFDASSSRLTFIHRSSGPAPPGLALTFVCTHARDTFACVAGSH